MKNNKKGLFMTILILILFLLILGELMTFTLLTYNYNSLDQVSAIGSSSLNYGKALQSSASLFANASLRSALAVLASYELNSSVRKSNFISNTSMYLSYLITNGTLPNVAANSIPANYLSNQMKNLTLLSYNSSVASLLNLGNPNIRINQTKAQIFQSSPYTITLSYLESITINSSSAGKFFYSIPVNATLPLNNTPDLYYYQQGQARNIRFGSLTNLTNVIGGFNATNGNYLGSAYGTVYLVPTGTTGLTCSTLSTMIAANMPAFSFAPYNQMLILATTNAIGITNGGSGPNCVNQYGGLITYGINSISNPPAIPWLSYPSATGVVTNMINGQHILILGNTLSTYNIQNLVDAATSGYYFASPLTPSYLDRGQASLTRQNPNGIFSFSSYSLQAGSFNGVSSYIQVPNSISINFLGGWTLSAWVNLNSVGTQHSVLEKYDWVPSLSVGGYVLRVGADNKVYTYVVNGQTSQQAVSATSLSANTWYDIVSTFDNNGILRVYINGALSGSNTVSLNSMPSSTTLKIGARGNDLGSPFNGMIADVQVYNKSLTPQQVGQLYQAGINGVPPTNSGLSGWWPLNGNANDYSGQLNNGVPVNVVYTLPANYVRDSILSTTVPTTLSPIPGLLNCNSNSQCSNTSLAHAYLGYNPLSIQQSFLQVAGFNGLTQNSYLKLPNPSNTLNIVGPVTVSAWVYPTSTTGLNNGNIYEAGGGCNRQFELFFEGSYAKFRLSQYNGGIGGDAIYPVNGLNVWYNLVGVWDGTNERLYINGTQVATIGPYSGNLVSNPNANSYIGALTPGCNNYDFIGNIANVQVYSAGLSANQVKSIYLGGIQGLPLSSSNALAGWWPLNGNANDYSGYADHGSINNVNFPYFNGAYNAPGLSSITTAANEWQTIGIPRSGG